MVGLKHGSTLKSGKYKIVKTLGQGSFGITYLATTRISMDGQLGKMDVNVNVTIKEFFMSDLNSRATDGTSVERTNSTLVKNYLNKFQREAANLSKLHHPNIVKVLEVFDENNTTYYVMEFIDGETIDEYIKRNGKLSVEESLKITKEVCAALSYMHDHKMLHLDLKPKNIMRDSEGHIYLIDFGLAKQYNENGEPESSTTLGLGTPGYAPIEQAHYKQDGTFPVTLDIYAVGASLYKMLTGKTPPESSYVLNDGLPLDALKHVGVDDNVIAIVEKAMAPIKKDRYQTVEYLLKDISSISSSDDERTTYIDDEKEQTTYEEELVINKKIEVERVNLNENQTEEVSPKSKTQTIIISLIGIILLSLGFFLSKCNSSITEYSPSYGSSQLAIEAQDLTATRYYAEKGDVRAMSQLGDVYRLGLWNTKDSLPAALFWYAKAADSGDAGSQFKLGCINLIRKGDNTAKQAIEWFRKAAKNDYKEAWYYLGELLRYDNKDESYHWMSKADSIGDLRAVGMMAAGWFDKIDPSIKTKAQKKIMALANNGNAQAIGVVSGLYMNGYMGHSPRDLDGSYKWAVKGIKLNDSESYELLGWYYYTIGQEKEADKYFEKGAEMGNILCMAKHSWGDGKYQRMRNEYLFNGKAVLMDGFGIYDASDTYSTTEERDTWKRRAVEYGWNQ